MHCSCCYTCSSQSNWSYKVKLLIPLDMFSFTCNSCHACLKSRLCTEDNVFRMQLCLPDGHLTCHTKNANLTQVMPLPHAMLGDFVDSQYLWPKLPSEAFQVICTQPQADFLPSVDIHPQYAHWTDPNFPLRGHLAQQSNRPSMLAHNAGNAGISSQPVQQLEGIWRGRGQARLLPRFKTLECVRTCK